MGKSKESKVSVEQMKSDLLSAKKKLTDSAEGLSIKAPMADHPYMSLGAAFISGATLGAIGDRDVGGRVVRTMAEVLGEKILTKE